MDITEVTLIDKCEKCLKQHNCDKTHSGALMIRREDNTKKEQSESVKRFHNPSRHVTEENLRGRI